MKKYRLHSVGLLLLMTTGNIFASDEETFIKNTYLAKALNTNRSVLELEAFSDKKLGKLTTKFNDGDNLYSFTIQGEIDEDSSEGTFADLDGLKNGNKVTFNYSRVFFNKKAVKEIAKSSEEACGELLPKLKKEAYAEVQMCFAEHKEKADKLSEDKRDAFYKMKCKSKIQAEQMIPMKCSDYNGYSDLLTQNLKDNDEISIHRFGVELSGGSNHYKWVDENTLIADKDTESAYSAELQYGFINSDYQRFNAGFRYENKWEGEKEQSLCTLFPASPTSLTCSSVAIGAPKESTARIYYVEWSQYFGKLDSKALSFRLSHDIETDLTGLDIPIYLYQEKENKGLQGGVRLGWVSDIDTTDTKKDDEDFIFSIFFNKGFSIK